MSGFPRITSDQLHTHLPLMRGRVPKTQQRWNTTLPSLFQVLEYRYANGCTILTSRILHLQNCRTDPKLIWGIKNSMAIQDKLNCGPLLETRQWLDQALRGFVNHWGMEASHVSNKVCHLDRKASHWHKMFPRPSSLDPVFPHVAQSFSTSTARTTLRSSFQQANHRNFACQSHPCGDPQLKKQSGKRRQERKGKKA
jgi:hypothetical protein